MRVVHAFYQGFIQRATDVIGDGIEDRRILQEAPGTDVWSGNDGLGAQVDGSDDSR